MQYVILFIWCLFELWAQVATEITTDYSISPGSYKDLKMRCFSAALVLSYQWEHLNNLLYHSRTWTKPRWGDKKKKKYIYILYNLIYYWSHIFLYLLPVAACAHPRSVVGLFNSVDQLQSGPAAAESLRRCFSTEQHDGPERTSSTGPGHLLQGKSSKFKQNPSNITLLWLKGDLFSHPCGSKNF